MTGFSGKSQVQLVGNVGTMIESIAALAFSPSLLASAYEVLAERLFAEMDPERHGLVVAAASPGTCEHGGGLITFREHGKLWSGSIGRHEMCSISLPSDDALSLRQVIVIASMTDDGCPITRALDLRSGTGMIDAASAMHESVVTNGPLRMRIGNSALFAIPTSELFLDGRVAGYDEIPWPTPARWIPVAAPEDRLDEISRATARSSVISLASEVERRARRMRRAIGLDCAGSFLVEVDGSHAEIEVDPVDLRSGVLFGRYPRCDINYLNAPMSEGISRVHALFLLVDEQLRVFDTGSTNGILYGAGDADGICLPVDRESRLSLYKVAAITWRPNRAT